MGCASVGIVTDEFVGFARTLLEQRNAGSLPLAIVGHPVGGIPRERAAALISDKVVDSIVMALQQQEPRAQEQDT